jgi:hypothetical protein
MRAGRMPAAFSTASPSLIWAASNSRQRRSASWVASGTPASALSALLRLSSSLPHSTPPMSWCSATAKPPACNVSRKLATPAPIWIVPLVARWKRAGWPSPVSPAANTDRTAGHCRDQNALRRIGREVGCFVVNAQHRLPPRRVLSWVAPARLVRWLKLAEKLKLNTASQPLPSLRIGVEMQGQGEASSHPRHTRRWGGKIGVRGRLELPKATVIVAAAQWIAMQSLERFTPPRLTNS